MKKFYTVYTLAVVAVGALIFYTLTACNQQTNTSETIKPKPVQKETAPAASSAKQTVLVTTEFQGNEEMGRIISKLSDDIQKINSTGNYEMDLAKMLSLHHLSAVEMLSLQLRNGKDQKLKEINEEILKAEKKEMSELLGIVRELRMKPTTMDSSSSEKARKLTNTVFESIKAMADSMQMAVATGELDKDFISIMIPYQKGAVSISKMTGKQTENKKIKKISQQIVSDKEEELKKLQDWLKKNNRDVAKLEN